MTDMFATYRSIPRTVRAVQFTDANKDQVLLCLTGQHAPGIDEDRQPILKITTVHGDVARVRLGDWIVEDAKPGTYYPVKDVIFRARYEVK